MAISFTPAPKNSDVVFFETIAFLFRDSASATKGLGIIEDGVIKIQKGRKAASPDLGEAAFAVRGSFGKAATLVYAWRVGDVVQLVTVAGKSAALPTEAQKISKELEARAKS